MLLLPGIILEDYLIILIHFDIARLLLASTDHEEGQILLPYLKDAPFILGPIDHLSDCSTPLLMIHLAPVPLVHQSCSRVRGLRSSIHSWGMCSRSPLHIRLRITPIRKHNAEIHFIALTAVIDDLNPPAIILHILDGRSEIGCPLLRTSLAHRTSSYIRVEYVAMLAIQGVAKYEVTDSPAAYFSPLLRVPTK